MLNCELKFDKQPLSLQMPTPEAARSRKTSQQQRRRRAGATCTRRPTRRARRRARRCSGRGFDPSWSLGPGRDLLERLGKRGQKAEEQLPSIGDDVHGREKERAVHQRDRTPCGCASFAQVAGGLGPREGQSRAVAGALQRLRHSAAPELKQRMGKLHVALFSFAINVANSVLHCHLTCVSVYANRYVSMRA